MGFVLLKETLDNIAVQVITLLLIIGAFIVTGYLLVWKLKIYKQIKNFIAGLFALVGIYVGYLFVFT
ncbi:hypothetical protein [Lederbergia citri]|uniref:Uncharacterized protein n=1 Tax=Lederbergia citri TaxID=2833580 RepID=A0A942YG65_9BACI|nr:hypothetical protein [Lederbergia citri]MBS4195798.1 hypothetical protein [Lederbergia citri]